MTDINNIKQSNGASLDYRERQAVKKAAREAEARMRRLKKNLKKVVYWIVGLTIVVGGVWWLISVTGPKGPDYSQAIPLLGRNHIADRTTYPSYNSNPPTSGPHYAVPATSQFYNKELPDEQLVHNLEHGHVWISYKPTVPPEIIKKLSGFAGRDVIVTMRSKNDSDISLAAWGRLDKFNLENGELPSQRISDFIWRYRNRGPENLNRPSHFNQ